MGNCVRKESSTEWGGDDWGSPDREKLRTFPAPKSSSSPSSTTEKSESKEVKIKISKKQLEKVLGKADVQGLSVEQLLSQLINVSDECETHHRPWRPALKSIPESEIY